MIDVGLEMEAWDWLILSFVAGKEKYSIAVTILKLDAPSAVMGIC
jgi:hypothetical protein